MSINDFAEFVQLFKLPILCAACAFAGVVLGLAFRDDSPRTEWPREDR
jgi:hypothetical protein